MTDGVTKGAHLSCSGGTGCMLLVCDRCGTGCYARNAPRSTSCSCAQSAPRASVRRPGSRLPGVVPYRPGGGARSPRPVSTNQVMIPVTTAGPAARADLEIKVLDQATKATSRAESVQCRSTDRSLDVEAICMGDDGQAGDRVPQQRRGLGRPAARLDGAVPVLRRAAPAVDRGRGGDRRRVLPGPVR